jgi:hypothetical protein
MSVGARAEQAVLLARHGAAAESAGLRAGRRIPDPETASSEAGVAPPVEVRTLALVVLAVIVSLLRSARVRRFSFRCC